MKTKKSLSSADFEYAEFSDDLFCPFCHALLNSTARDDDEDFEEQLEQMESNPDSGGVLECEHVGFWSFGRLNEPHVNESWRNEMFMLTKLLKNELDCDDGGDWPEALNFAMGEEGNLGWAVAKALPAYRVAVYKQFTYVHDCPRVLTYMAVLLMKKSPPNASPQTATRSR